MNAALEAEYRRLHMAVSQAQQTYLESKTPENWAAYLAADKVFRPVSVRYGQAEMQAQIDRMDSEQFESFRRMND